MQTVTLHQGTIPVLISLPHNGVKLPDDISPKLTERAKHVPDTDWHVEQLYAFARQMGASVLVPHYSRYVIDLNRPADNQSLYPGQNTTGLCPLVGFDGEPIYLPGQEPDQDDINARLETYWKPYHQHLEQEIERIRQLHGHVLLWEGHSIRGELPFLFEGRLPDLNIGTADGTSCDQSIQSSLEKFFANQSQYDYVFNGRFKGGYITRHYGDPENAVNAVQLELSQRTYMDEETFKWDEQKSTQLMTMLEAMFKSLQSENII